MISEINGNGGGSNFKVIAAFGQGSLVADDPKPSPALRQLVVEGIDDL